MPAYDTTDELFLNSARLVRVSVPGQMPEEYRTEHDTFARIPRLADGSFEVTLPSGVRQLYGSAPPYAYSTWP